MKQLVGILSLCILLCMGTSCDDLLNPEPENSVTYYNFFKTEKDVETAVWGIHTQFRATLYESRQLFVASGEVIDEIRSVNDDLKGLYNLDGSVITDTRPFLSWKGFYNVIDQTMLVLENIDRAGLSKDRNDFYIGQALFFKAYMYFQIIQIWGDCPYKGFSYEMKALPRTPWQDVLNSIIKDAENATKLLQPWKKLTGADGKAITTLQIPGREAAYALLAHLYAWKGTLENDKNALQKGIEAASYVIDEGGFSLAANPEEVCKKVLMGGHSESIFEADIDYTEMYGLHAPCHMESYFQGYPIQTNRTLEDVISNDMYIKGTRVLDMYKEGDLRRDAYFYMPDSMVRNEKTKGWALMYKRRDIIRNTEITDLNEQFQNFAGNEIIYRLAEVLLLRAEMYAKLGDSDDLAIADLKRVRDRAQAPEYKAEEGNLYYIIFKEREKELICERHRRFDMTRTGFYGELSEAFAKLTSADVADGALFSPVYKGAFNDNPHMRQNRYWTKKW